MFEPLPRHGNKDSKSYLRASLAIACTHPKKLLNAGKAEGLAECTGGCH
jgi:hypothetical protein